LIFSERAQNIDIPFLQTPGFLEEIKYAFSRKEGGKPNPLKKTFRRGVFTMRSPLSLVKSKPKKE